MNAIPTPAPAVAHALVITARRQIRRIGPLGSIILLHALFFYALQSGLLRQAAQVLPKEVFATFITSDAPQPNPPQPQPAAQLTVPAVRKAIMPTPIAAAVSSTPSPQAITAAPTSVDSPSGAAETTTAAATAPASAAPAPPKTISAVEYIQAPQPDYPASSKRIGEEGKVLLRVLVNEEGRPERVEVQKSSGSARLDEAARQAALRALFKPYIEDGKALAVYALVPISFQLDNF